MRQIAPRRLPTYERDLVGPIQRWDERDILFARKDLFQYIGVDTPEYTAYYAAHPEHLAFDSKIGLLPELGKTAGHDLAMFEAQFAAIRYLGPEAAVDGQPSPQRIEFGPERAAHKIKALARLLGADLVKIGPLRQEWAYSHVGRSRGNAAGYPRRGAPIDLRHHSNAIALGVRMDHDLIQTAPDFPVLLATAQGYALGAWVSVQLAEYIRRLGYSARAHHLTNYQVLCVPVGVDCGLGELSRAGYLLTQELGPGLRLSVVTTDLPLAHDGPVDIGVQSFCETCKICAEECPIGAIPTGGKTESNGIRKWKLDEEKCYRYWHAVGTDCARCMAACPWTRPRTRFHATAAKLASIAGPHQAWMTQAHKLFYGKFKTAPRPEFIEARETGPRA